MRTATLTSRYIVTVWCYSKPTDTDREVFVRRVVSGRATSPEDFCAELSDLYSDYDEVAFGGISLAKDQTLRGVGKIRAVARRGRTKAEVLADPRPVL